MIARVALVFGGLVVAIVLSNLYFIAFCAVFVFILGVENNVFLSTGYAGCLIGGAVTAFFLVRPGWPKSPNKSLVGDGDGQQSKS